MLQELKEKVLEANLDLVKHGLVVSTWGNASAIDRASGCVVIKPSGVSYDTMTAEDMVVVDMDGNQLDGSLKPSSDLPTHLELYRNFEDIEGVVHTHSVMATAWAQAGRALPILGTTHADYFSSNVPCTRRLTDEEISGEYEKSTAVSIIDTFKGIHPLHIPAVLVINHGVFTWGKSVSSAVLHALALEEVAKMATTTLLLNPDARIPENLVMKHFQRKHGPYAYYGQT